MFTGVGVGVEKGSPPVIGGLDLDLALVVIVRPRRCGHTSLAANAPAPV
jgi:hypothetical protein